MTVKDMGRATKARELLAAEYERGGNEGPYPTYAGLARAGCGAFTQCSLRAIEKALALSPPEDQAGWREDALRAGMEKAAEALEAWADGFMGGSMPDTLRAAAVDLRRNAASILAAPPPQDR